MEFYVQVAERDPVGYTGSETINALRFKVKEAEALPIGIGRLKFYTRRGEREVSHIQSPNFFPKQYALPPSTRLTELPPGTGTVTNPLHVPYDEEARPAAEAASRACRLPQETKPCKHDRSNIATSGGTTRKRKNDINIERNR
eukprot:640204-Amphidinium_carterae.1